MQRSVGTTAHDVAGVKPATLPGFGGRLRIFQILAKETKPRVSPGVANQQFALFGSRSVLGDDATFHIRRRAGRSNMCRCGEAPRSPRPRLRRRSRSSPTPRSTGNRNGPRTAHAAPHPRRHRSRNEPRGPGRRIRRVGHQDRRHDPQIMNDGRSRIRAPFATRNEDGNDPAGSGNRRSSASPSPSKPVHSYETTAAASACALRPGRMAPRPVKPAYHFAGDEEILVGQNAAFGPPRGARRI